MITPVITEVTWEGNRHSKVMLQMISKETETKLLPTAVLILAFPKKNQSQNNQSRIRNEDIVLNSIFVNMIKTRLIIISPISNSLL
jgi:hypothetical protein